MTEYIICSAVWFKDGNEYLEQPKGIDTGMVVCGRRHSNCYWTYSILTKDLALKNGYPDSLDGFLTNTNRFVDRYEGYNIAEKSKQLFFETNSRCLQSEFIFKGD